MVRQSIPVAIVALWAGLGIASAQTGGAGDGAPSTTSSLGGHNAASGVSDSMAGGAAPSVAAPQGSDGASQSNGAGASPMPLPSAASGSAAGGSGTAQAPGSRPSPLAMPETPAGGSGGVPQGAGAQAATGGAGRPPGGPNDPAARLRNMSIMQEPGQPVRAIDVREKSPRRRIAPAPGSGRNAAGASASERAALRRAVLAAGVQPLGDAGFHIAVGAVVPSSVMLHDLPARAAEAAPAYGAFDFFVLRNRTVVIVDPATREVQMLIRG